MRLALRMLVLASVLALGGPLWAEPPAAQPVKVVVIPVKTAIADPELYVIRRGLKEAIAQKADWVVLDIKTPGGALDSTFQIMEALEKFHGHTIAFVDNEAMSAGSFISAVTQEIWLTPDGVIGAAAPVDSEGKDIDSTMKEKLVSYLKARMRAVSEGKGHRGEVISAMIDADSELKIGDRVIKTKGQLLSLTAKEAMQIMPDDGKPLLGSGTATSIDDLLKQRLHGAPTEVTTLELTWSERLAVLLNSWAPLLMGIGMFALFIEFKTPGFGIFGVTGVLLLGIVFFGGYVAGLSGHEPVILFVLGVILVMLEMLFFHSAGFLGVAGILAIAGSLIWATSDLWPNEPLSVAWSADAFAMPAARLGLALAITMTLAILLWRFLPKGWFWQQFVITSAPRGSAQVAGLSAHAAVGALVGAEGIVATDLRPSGQIVVDGKRLEARLDVGTAVSGERVRIVRSSDFAVVVERVES